VTRHDIQSSFIRKPGFESTIRVKPLSIHCRRIVC